MNIFTDSLEAYLSGFSLNSAVMLIMVIFMFVGAIDLLHGNKLGYGERFEDGFKILGEFFLVLVGVYGLIPVICALFKNAIGILFTAIGCDPSLFAGMFIGCDMGAYPLALELTDSASMAAYSSLLIGSIMGVNIVWTIPIGMQTVKGEDIKFMSQGMLLGLITVPVGSVLGGIAMIPFGYDITVKQAIMNSIPVTVLSFLIILGFLLAQEKLIRLFVAFGDVIVKICIVSTAISVFQYLTDIRLPLLHLMVEPDSTGTVPIINAGIVLTGVGFILLGAFPMVKFITDKFQKPLTRLGRRFGLDDVSVAGLIACMANVMIMIGVFKDMNPKGKVLNAAFAIAGAFALGDHMGFTASIDKNMVVPVLFAKLAAGFSAIIVVFLFWKKIAPTEDEA